MTRRYSANLFIRLAPTLKSAFVEQTGRQGLSQSHVIERLIENWLDDVAPAPAWNRELMELRGRVEELEFRSRNGDWAGGVDQRP